MRYLFAHWRNFEQAIAEKCVLLFLDYDGTLTAIAESPNKALLPKQTRTLLRRLSASSRCKLVIMSGRALRDIKERVGLTNIIYSGNHGLQMWGPGVQPHPPVSPAYKAVLKQIRTRLRKRLSLLKGVLIEDKELSIGLHYRQVNNAQISFVKTAFHQIAGPFLTSNRIKVTAGKKVLEIMPSGQWNKGKGVLWLLRTCRAARHFQSIVPVYVGDDITDEDAFKALKDTGPTVFVGPVKKSYADYYSKSTAEVFQFLERLISLLTS